MDKWRLRLFIGLVLLAPLSLVPYLPLPLENFTSLRIGFYQILAVVFVVIMLPKLKRPGKQALTLGCLVVLVALLGSILAVSKSRALIMSLSIGLLIAIFWAGWSFVSSIGPKRVFGYLRRPMLWASIIYGGISLVQLILTTLSDQNYLLCKGCVDDVFGFPRINGFAAEPLFWANALLPFYFVSLHVFMKTRTRLSLAALVSITLAATLTFARGAYIAAAIGSLVLLMPAVKKSWRSTVLAAVILVITFASGILLLVLSATYGYRSAPYIFRNTVVSIIDHLTLGVVDIPPKVEQINEVPDPAIEHNFVSEGLIEASTNERLDSASLAYQAWQHTKRTWLIGTGPGNLGPYVVSHINSAAPNNLTVYIYYVLILAELGVLGLLSLVYTFVKIISRLWSAMEYRFIAALLVAFGVHYLFFGSTINVIYIWLWLGIGLAASREVYSQGGKKK